MHVKYVCEKRSMSKSKKTKAASHLQKNVDIYSMKLERLAVLYLHHFTVAYRDSSSCDRKGAPHWLQTIYSTTYSDVWKDKLWDMHTKFGEKKWNHRVGRFLTPQAPSKETWCSGGLWACRSGESLGMSFWRVFGHVVLSSGHWLSKLCICMSSFRWDHMHKYMYINMCT